MQWKGFPAVMRLRYFVGGGLSMASGTRTHEEKTLVLTIIKHTETSSIVSEGTVHRH